MKNVEETVKKYAGTLNTEVKDGKYITDVILYEIGIRHAEKKRIVVDKVSFLTFPSEIRTSNWEKQPGDMYCVRTVGAAPALRARLLRSYVPLRCDRVKTCAITIHISRRIFYKSTSYFPYRIPPLPPVLYGFRSRFRYC